MAYASEIASLGQVPSHAPQSMHSSALITYEASPALIAPTGQTSAQEPQETQRSGLIILGIVVYFVVMCFPSANVGIKFDFQNNS